MMSLFHIGTEEKKELNNDENIKLDYILSTITLSMFSVALAYILIF